MTYFEKTTTNFLKQLEFEIDYYDVYSKEELTEQARYFLDAYEITINENCDYRNDQNEDGHYYCDVASEWADSMVDIYNSDLWEKAPKFQWWIQDAIDEFDYDKKRGIIGLFQMGQYLYYSRFA